MKRSKFSEHQIIAILKAVEAGRTVRDVCREHEDPVTGSHGISLAGGLYGADAEFNADGVNVGFAEPTSPAPEDSGFKYPEVAICRIEHE